MILHLLGIGPTDWKEQYNTCRHTYRNSTSSTTASQYPGIPAQEGINHNSEDIIKQVEVSSILFGMTSQTAPKTEGSDEEFGLRNFQIQNS